MALFLFLSLVHAVFYVACIYAAVALRPPPPDVAGSRDHPHVIGQRIRGAVVATAASLAATAYTLRKEDWVSQLGLAPRAALGSACAGLVLTCALYLGPLTMDCLDRQSPWALCARPSAVWWRNYVVGPVTEELVFRSVVVSLWLAAGVSSLVAVLVSPLVFSVAHIHHAVASYCAGTPLSHAAAAMLAQLAYTSLFGCYAAMMFVRTGSVVGPVVAHIVCNVQGLPSISRINQHPAKYALWAVHGAGVLGLVLLFEPMTRPGIFYVKG
ncbi:CAAX prenyl protease [Coemansia sp. BCRC 34301]|nr:CAAX prenyl protease [Coemansia sp. BCRC 34301]